MKLSIPESEERARAIVMGKVVEALRLKQGLTQGQLAQLVGSTQATISRLESGNLLRPDAFLFRELAGAFNLVPEQLHSRVDAAIAQAKSATSSKSSGEWWSSLGTIALGAFALYAMLSLIEDDEPEPKPRKPPKSGSKA